MSDVDLQTRAINTIRFLAVDAVEKAKSGHPGMPMGAAAMAYVLWTRHLKFDPTAPSWADRDRFVLSAGHGSMLLYALLNLTGYNLSLDDLKSFRQLGSKTPGHPEHGETPGVEVTTGPLGQGFGNAVGMAIATERLAAMYNVEDFNIVDHYVYVIASDGDLMEGISHETASLAGHLRLGRLICLYDDNRITIDGSTDLTFTEDQAGRFRAYGWQVIPVEDGNDIEAVDQALHAAKADPRPSLIVCRTHIGYGALTKQDTAAAHGAPLGVEVLEGAKKKLGWPLQPHFYIPEDVKDHFLAAAGRGQRAHREWKELFARFGETYPQLASQFERTQAGKLPDGLSDLLPVFVADEKGTATRNASGVVLNALAPALPEMIGGSADISESNNTLIQGEAPFTAEDRSGRYLHFGVREHGMEAISNGLALYGGLIPYCGTMLVFSDYMRPALRLAALMHLRVIHVLINDSIGVGEDGPTHQPIEHLTSLRAIPNLTVIRPADANETAIAWMVALKRSSGPTVLALSRQATPTIDRTHFAAADGLQHGAYILKDLSSGPIDVVLMASGTEVALIIEAGEQLAQEGIGVRLVSFPSWELFAEQTESYQREVLVPEVRVRLAVEAGSPQGWERWVGAKGAVIGLNYFGVSAPYQEIYRHLGITRERIVGEARLLLARQGI